MIIALVLVDPLPLIDGTQPYFLNAGGATVLERTVARVLRGPFGGTLVATSSALEERCREILSGFAVQFAVAEDPAFVVRAGLLEAGAFRKRWEKAMAQAAQRFGSRSKSGGVTPLKNARTKDDDTDQDDGETANTDWKGLQKNADVKIRSLARSFECDGVMLFRGERAGLRLETQAFLIDSFTRELQQGSAKTLARITVDGVGAYPLLAQLSAVKQMESLPLAVRLESWLATQDERMLRVECDDPAAGAELKTPADFKK